MERRLAAILAAGVVGYSQLMSEDEAETLERLKSLRKELVQPKIRARGGRIVKLVTSPPFSHRLGPFETSIRQTQNLT